MPASGLGLLELGFVFALALGWGLAEWWSLRRQDRHDRKEPPPDDTRPAP